MIDLFLMPENLPFAVAIALMLFIGLLEGVGMLLGFAISGILDNLVPDMELEVDADIGDHGAFGEFLSWLRIREVPVIAILIAFLASFGATGLALQQILNSVLGFSLPSLVAAVIAFFLAFPGVRLFAGVLAKIMPRDETSAISTQTFIGRTATITLGTAKEGSPAEGKFRDQFGTTHYVMLAPDVAGEEFPQGSEMLIVRQDGATYYGIAASVAD